MHPHIPRPRRKATRTCTDTAAVVRTVHGESMWPFTARVNEKTAPIERIAAVAICRRLKGRPQADLCSTVKRPTTGLRVSPPMTAQIATALGPVLDEPGALQQHSTVHVRYGSRLRENAAARRTDRMDLPFDYEFRRNDSYAPSILIDLRKIILARSEQNGFSHSQGHERPIRSDRPRDL